MKRFLNFFAICFVVAVKVQPIARSDSYVAGQKILQQPFSSVCAATKSWTGGVSQQTSLLLHPSSTASCQFHWLGKIRKLNPVSYELQAPFHLIEVIGIMWLCVKHCMSVFTTRTSVNNISQYNLSPQSRSFIITIWTKPFDCCSKTKQIT